MKNEAAQINISVHKREGSEDQIAAIIVDNDISEHFTGSVEEFNIEDLSTLHTQITSKLQLLHRKVQLQFENALQIYYQVRFDQLSLL